MRQIFSGLFVFLLIIVLLLQPSQKGPDALHYLAWEQSLVHDGDLSLLNQFEALQIDDYHVTTTGLVGELRNFGVALFWLPFSALATQTTGGNNDAQQPLFLAWSTLIYLALACALMLMALQRFYAPGSAWLAVGLLWLGTPLAFYAFQQPISAHPVSVCLAALLLGLSLKKAKTFWPAFSSGILAGWLMAVATYNVAVLLIPLTENVSELIAQRQWRRFLRQNSALGLGVVLGFLPQMIVWQLLYGNLFATPYARQMQWAQPYLGEVLFSSFHGLFLYAPLLFFVPFGLFLLARQNKPLALGIALSWFALTYLVSVNLAWWAGTSFGNRYFLVLSPFFALALGALLQQSYRWLWLLIPACLWTLGLWLEYAGHNVMLVSPNRYYPPAELVAAQTRIWENLKVVTATWPSSWLSSTPPLLIAEILLLSLGFYGLGYYGLRRFGQRAEQGPAYWLGALSLCLIGYVIVLGYRTTSQQQVQTKLTGAQAQQVSAYDPLDLTESYMERAKYHFAINRADLAVRDAQQATLNWPSPGREIVGYHQLSDGQLSQPLDVEYGALQLLGYRWQAPNQLTLYWKKAKHDSKHTYSPLIQIKDAGAQVIGQSQLADPFPAKLISMEYIFCDHFTLDQTLAAGPLSFAISFPAEQIDSQTFYPLR